MVKLFWLDKGLKLKGTLKLKDGKEASGTAFVLGVQGMKYYPVMWEISHKPL